MLSGEKKSIEKLPSNKLNTIRHVIAVMSGKGGVGKSSVTSLVAVNLARKGYKTGILDADITGSSIPKMFGIHRKPETMEFGIMPVESSQGIKIISINLLLENEDDPVIWRGPLLAGTVKQFWTDVIWDVLDFLVVDLPPGTGDIPLTVMQSLPVDGLVVVTSPQDLAVMIVKKAVKMAGILKVPVLRLVENMSYVKCPHCEETFELFGRGKSKEEAEQAGIPFLGRLPVEPKFAALCDRGKIEEYKGFSALDLSPVEEKLQK